MELAFIVYLGTSSFFLEPIDYECEGDEQRAIISL